MHWFRCATLVFSVVIVIIAECIGLVDTFPHDCGRHEPLYRRIYEDLLDWQANGITEDMRKGLFNINRYESPWRFGIYTTLLVSNGRVYVTDRAYDPAKPDVMDRHMLPMLMDVLETATRYQLPDLELAISNSDYPPPQSWLNNENRTRSVYGIWAKSPGTAAITIPYSDHHRSECNNMPKYANSLDDLHKAIFTTATLNPAHQAWSQRQDKAFTRYRGFCTFWVGNQLSWHLADDSGVECPRKHLLQLQKQYPHDLDVQDVSTNGKSIVLLNHSNYRYLIYTDGWSSSSKMEFYSILGSTVLKQEGPIKAYFTHAMHAFEHYIPWYTRHRTDVMDALWWARSNPSKAEQISRNAQQFVREHLSHDARICYWQKLFEEVGRYMRYTPKCDSTVPMCVPLEEVVLDIVSKTGHCSNASGVLALQRLWSQTNGSGVLN